MWRTNLKVIMVALAVIGFYTGLAHMIPQLESDVPESLDLSGDVTPEALALAGEGVFNGAGGCTACHGLGTRAPSLVTSHAGQGPIGARCDSREQGKDCKTYLYEALTEPGAYVVAGFQNIMQDMRKQLPMDQVWAVVAFLQSQGGEITVTADDLPGTTEGGAGDVQPAAATAFSGTTDPRQLLTENGCLGCHQMDGVGPPIGPSFDGMGGRISVQRIRQGILDPDAEIAEGFEQFAGMMLKNFGEKLSAAQLETLVQFLAGRK